MSKAQWCSESIVTGVRVSYKASRVLAQMKTACQQLVILQNEPFGRVLMLDDVVQTTTRDEFIYHEMLGHTPLLAHPCPKDVLIVGGGDCGLAREVLRHTGVRKVTQVEIDPDVVELSRKHLSEMNAAVFADSRFELRIADGAAFVNECESSFDVVLIDSTDPIGASRALFARDFYAAVQRRMRPDGVLVAQAGVPFLQSEGFRSTLVELASVFQVVDCYLIAAPSYFGGHLAFAWASNDLVPESVSLQTLTERYAASGLRTRYYTPSIQKAAFVLPPYIRELMPRWQSCSGVDNGASQAGSICNTRKRPSVHT